MTAAGRLGRLFQVPYVRFGMPAVEGGDHGPEGGRPHARPGMMALPGRAELV